MRLYEDQLSLRTLRYAYYYKGNISVSDIARFADAARRSRVRSCSASYSTYHRGVPRGDSHASPGSSRRPNADAGPDLRESCT